MGHLTRVPLFYPLNVFVLERFIETYHVNRSEIPAELSSYKNFAEFFTRKLPVGVRQIESDIISPVDGMLRNVTTIKAGHVELIKGHAFSIQKLLADSKQAEKYDGGVLCNFYLAPGDYHHVHSVCSGKLLDIKKLPGSLWSVNNLTFEKFPDVLSENERVLLPFETEWGQVMVILVGALNVGKIEINFKTQQVVSVGERAGTFHMGSSVVLLFEPGFEVVNSISNSTKVLMGEDLLKYIKKPAKQ